MSWAREAVERERREGLVNELTSARVRLRERESRASKEIQIGRKRVRHEETQEDDLTKEKHDE